MRSKTSYLLVLIACLGASFLINMASADEYDFRKVRWGMTKDEVRKSEGMESSHEDDVLRYDGEYFGGKARLSFSFTDGKLSSSGCLFDASLGFDFFTKVSKKLTGTYGNPVDGSFFGSDLYILLGENLWQQGDKLVEEGSIDLADGELFYLAKLEWLGEKTHASILFMSDSPSIRIFLKYHLLPQTDFRDVKWGMSREEVIKAIKSNDTQFQGEFLISDDNMLAYDATVADMVCIVAYGFTQDILTSTSYHFREKHTNENDYIQDYSKLKGILEKKYGKPDDDDVTWSDSLYENDKEKWGFAVSVGHLAFQTKWKVSTSEVFLRLSGDNYEINLVTVYYSKKHKKLREKEKEKEVLEDF